MTRPNQRLALASALFLASGFAALVYQVIWQRILGIFSGQHIYSITLIVTAFMAGLGFGSLLAGRLADRLSRRWAVVGFAVCELAIGLFALASPWLYYDVAYLGLGHLVRYPLVVPLLHFSLLLLPTSLMGASLPLLSRALVVAPGAAAARTIGTLYGLNTLGAALGAFATVWYMIGALGFVTSLRMTAALNLGAALGAWWMLRFVEDGEDGGQRSSTGDGRPVAPSPVTERSGSTFSLPHWAAIYAFSGFVALSLEILWFRILDVAIKSSPYTFGHLLGTFLLFLALGSLVGSRVSSRTPRPDLIFLWGQWGITVTAAAALLVLCYYPTGFWPLAGLFEFWNTDRGIVMIEIADALAGRGPSWILARVVQIYGALPLFLLGVPTFLMGLTYAFIQRTVQTDLRSVGWRVGLIQTANIVGSMTGSLLTGAVLLDVLGTADSLRLLILGGGLFGMLAASRGRAAIRTRVLAVAVVSLLLAAALPGGIGFWARLHGSLPEDVLVAEDASSIVALQRLPSGQAVLRVNGTGHSMLPYGGAHTQLGGIPVLLHPEPKNVLLIGLGAGNTAWAAASVPSVQRIDLYEIARPELEVIAASLAQWYPNPALQQLLSDPRLHLTFSDGRLALRLEDRRYDVIEADALEPYMAYSGNLYSKEFFELALSRLEPGGLFCTYAPTDRTRRTMIQAFPHVLLFSGPGNLNFALGSDQPIDFDPGAVLARLTDPAVRDYFLRSNMSSALVDIGGYLRGARVVIARAEDRELFEGQDFNSDLFPRDEFDKEIPVE